MVPLRRSVFPILFAAVFAAGGVSVASAQCSMCKGNAESSLKEGKSNAKGLNTGIMYMLAIPYLLVGGIGYYWYVNHRKQEEEEAQPGS